MIALAGCASAGHADRLRAAYDSSGIRAQADFDCDSLSAEQCECVRSTHADLTNYPDDSSLLEAERMMSQSGLGKPTGGFGAITFTIAVAPFLIVRSHELCGVEASLGEAWDQTDKIKLEQSSS